MKISTHNNDFNIRLNAEEMQRLFTIEYCPCCEIEQIIWANGISECPVCSASLVPCSICRYDNGGCSYAVCPYKCNGSQADLKLPITMPRIHFDSYEVYDKVNQTI